MPKDLFEEMLGPDAPTILQQAAVKHPRLISSQELEAVQTYLEHPKELTDLDKAALVDLLTAVADDFSSRRRAELIRSTAYAPPEEVEYEDAWLEDENGNCRPRRGSRPVGRREDDDGNGLEAFLDSLDED